MKIKMTISILMCAALIGTTAARAEETVDKRWYIAPGINYIFADTDRQSDNGGGVRLGIGRAVSRSWNLELNGVLDSLSIKDSDRNYDQKGISLNALYFFTRDWMFSPYGVIGAGALETKVPGERSTNLMAEIGLGLSQTSKEGAAVRIEVRHRYDGDDSSVADEDEFNDWMAGFTLAIPLEKGAKQKEAKETKEAAAPAPKDDDGDGVNNDMDKCPGTPAGVKVDPRGCPLDSDGDGVADSMDKCPETPAGSTVDSKGCPPDLDGDGVADNMDKCSETPVGVKVDPKGCPLDSDGDGVADYLDKCPDTRPKTPVDDNGCALPERVSVTLKIEFATGKADIQSEYHDEIKVVADFMTRYPSTTVEIGGHTDNVGKEAANISLSQKRADAVREYLIEKFGIDGSRITSKGYGSKMPVADNSTDAGRQQNRRVEAVIETMVRK